MTDFDISCAEHDGYIIDQGRLAPLAFSRSDSAASGCGWIAAYNLLHALGREITPEEVFAALTKRVFFGGKLGISVFAVRRYLRRQGVDIRFCFSYKRAPALAEKGGAGILLYWIKHNAHYTTFRAEAGALHFYNARYGVTKDITTLGNFLVKRAGNKHLFILLYIKNEEFPV